MVNASSVVCTLRDVRTPDALLPRCTLRADLSRRRTASFRRWPSSSATASSPSSGRLVSPSTVHSNRQLRAICVGRSARPGSLHQPGCVCPSTFAATRPHSQPYPSQNSHLSSFAHSPSSIIRQTATCRWQRSSSANSRRRSSTAPRPQRAFWQRRGRSNPGRSFPTWQWEWEWRVSECAGGKGCDGRFPRFRPTRSRKSVDPRANDLSRLASWLVLASNGPSYSSSSTRIGTYFSGVVSSVKRPLCCGFGRASKVAGVGQQCNTHRSEWIEPGRFVHHCRGLRCTLEGCAQPSRTEQRWPSSASTGSAADVLGRRACLDAYPGAQGRRTRAFVTLRPGRWTVWGFVESTWSGWRRRGDDAERNPQRLLAISLARSTRPIGRNVDPHPQQQSRTRNGRIYARELGQPVAQVGTVQSNVFGPVPRPAPAAAV